MSDHIYMPDMSGHGGHGGHEGHNMNSTQPPMVHMMMMAMSFYVSSEVNPLVFKSWIIKTPGEMVGSCIAIIIISIVYEGLKVVREIFKEKEATVRRSMQSDVHPSVGAYVSPGKIMCSMYHLIQTLMHMIQVFVGYILMLAAMCYNVWIFLAIVVGSGCGYFLFGWRKSGLSDSGDHCN